MKRKQILGAGATALLALSPVLALADPVDNPGPVTFTIATGSSAQVGSASLSFGGSDPPSTISGTVDGQGNVTIPMDSVVFQPINVMVGTFLVTVQPRATSDASGAINAFVGNATATFNIRFDISGLLIPPGCNVPNITLNVDTGLGASYNPMSGVMTAVDNTFAVPASDSCGLVGPLIDAQFGLPSASGNNTATLVLNALPILTGSP